MLSEIATRISKRWDKVAHLWWTDRIISDAIQYDCLPECIDALPESIQPESGEEQ